MPLLQRTPMRLPTAERGSHISRASTFSGRSKKGVTSFHEVRVARRTLALRRSSASSSATSSKLRAGRVVVGNDDETAAAAAAAFASFSASAASTSKRLYRTRRRSALVPISSIASAKLCRSTEMPLSPVLRSRSVCIRDVASSPLESNPGINMLRDC